MTSSSRLSAPGVVVAKRALRVLLAEDDEEFRTLLTSLLLRSGYEVIGVETGKELLEYLASVLLFARRSDQPDIVLSDIRMPGISGLEILAGLRRARWGLPVVLMTAFGDERTHAEAARWGAHVLDKPFDLDALMGQLRRVAIDRPAPQSNR